MTSQLNFCSDAKESKSRIINFILRDCALLSVACALFLVAATAQSDPAVSQIPAGPYHIAGTVINTRNSVPLAQCRVTISDAKKRNRELSIVTGDNGRFAFRVPAGKYSLVGARHGFIPSAYDRHEQFSTAIVTGVGLDTENLSLRLPPNAVVTGRVLDEFGEPVRDARVAIYREVHFQGTSQTRHFLNSNTDDLGRYEAASLTEGTYFISARADPWYAIHPSVNLAAPGAQGSHVDSSLDVGYLTTYYGDVTDANDATPIPVRGGDRLQADIHLTPVPALHMLIRTSENESRQTHFPILQTPVFEDTDRVNFSIQFVSPGLYEINGIPAGKYMVRSADDSGQMQKEAVEMNLSSSGELQQSEVRPTTVIEAKVQVEGAANLPGDMKIGLLNSKNLFGGSAPVNTKGEAQFSEVIADNYDVVAFSSTERYDVVQIDSGNGISPGHALTVPAGASLKIKLSVVMGSVTIEGFAKQSGNAVAGAMVVLVPKNPSANHDRFRRDQSDLDGSFSLGNVIPGSYTIIAINGGWDLDWASPAVIANYLTRGRPIEAKAGSAKSVQTSEDVEVQSK